MGRVPCKYEAMRKVAENRLIEAEYRKPKPMKQPKPIFMIGVPYSQGMADQEALCKKLAEKMPDYHIIVHSSKSPEAIFKAFYPPHFDESIIAKIKDALKEEVHQTKFEARPIKLNVDFSGHPI